MTRVHLRGGMRGPERLLAVWRRGRRTLVLVGCARFIEQTEVAKYAFGYLRIGDSRHHLHGSAASRALGDIHVPDHPEQLRPVQPKGTLPGPARRVLGFFRGLDGQAPSRGGGAQLAARTLGVAPIIESQVLTYEVSRSVGIGAARLSTPSLGTTFRYRDNRCFPSPQKIIGSHVSVSRSPTTSPREARRRRTWPLWRRCTHPHPGNALGQRRAGRLAEFRRAFFRQERFPESSPQMRDWQASHVGSAASRLHLYELVTRKTMNTQAKDPLVGFHYPGPRTRPTSLRSLLCRTKGAADRSQGLLLHPQSPP